MILTLISILTSLIISFVIVRVSFFKKDMAMDNDFFGPQKNHFTKTPRIGGIPIFLGLLATAIMGNPYHDTLNNTTFTLMACAVPVFIIGLLEDLTKRISVSLRLIFTLLSSLIFIGLFQVEISTVDIPIVDSIFQLPYFGLLFTIFAIVGLSNAYNIIDGFNGLSSMIGIITITSIAYISYRVGDQFIFNQCLIIIGSALGFFILNYPRGLIFLGDGGAYLLGFFVSALSLLLVIRNFEISPWFALVVNSYPMFETLYSIYRRKIHKGKNPLYPDGMHFHTLIYSRILRKNSSGNFILANAKTSPYLWALNMLCIIPALLFYKSTWLLIISLLIFCIFYIWLYARIVRFKTPKWLFKIAAI